MRKSSLIVLIFAASLGTDTIAFAQGGGSNGSGGMGMLVQVAAVP